MEKGDQYGFEGNSMLMLHSDASVSKNLEMFLIFVANFNLQLQFSDFVLSLIPKIKHEI